GGGTVIDPALEYVINIAQKGDLVLIFTDGGISITPNTHTLAKMLRDRVCRIYMTEGDIFDD
ncbi:MAG: hypothetical protein ACO2O0_07835, partial [Desulfurococcales archaeon]